MFVRLICKVPSKYGFTVPFGEHKLAISRSDNIHLLYCCLPKNTLCLLSSLPVPFPRQELVFVRSHFCRVPTFYSFLRDCSFLRLYSVISGLADGAGQESTYQLIVSYQEDSIGERSRQIHGTRIELT